MSTFKTKYKLLEVKPLFKSVSKDFLLIVMLCFAMASVQAESDMVDAIAKIKSGIVAVGTYMPKRNPRAVFLGTGFAIGNGSLIVTNAHVIPENLIVENMEQITVFFRKDNVDKVIQAQEVARDKDHDITILKISGEKMPPLKLGSGRSVREGQFFAFTGFPMGMVLGLYPVTHRGMISAIAPNVIPMIKAQHLSVKVLKRLEDPYEVFQLDATAYPGNSGSPLYDPNSAEVVGIINKVFVQESKENVLSKPSGITYAIPVNHIQNLLNAKGLN